MPGALIARRAGDWEREAQVAIEGSEALAALGERGWLSTSAGYAAQALVRLGRDAEAEHWIGVADDVGTEDDVVTQGIIRQVRGLLAMRRGELDEAERLVRAAVTLFDATDAVEGQAEAQLDLAEVLRAAGRTDEANAAVEKAVGLFEEKGHTVGVAQARALLAATPS